MTVFVNTSFVLEEVEVRFNEDLYASRDLGRRFIRLVRREGSVVIRHIAGNRDRAGEVFLGIKNVVAVGIVAAKLAQNEVAVLRRAERTDHFVFEDTDGSE